MDGNCRTRTQSRVTAARGTASRVQESVYVEVEVSPTFFQVPKKRLYPF